MFQQTAWRYVIMDLDANCRMLKSIDISKSFFFSILSFFPYFWIGCCPKSSQHSLIYTHKTFLLLAFLDTSVEIWVYGEAGSLWNLCLFFHWSRQGFQRGVLDLLIEMEFSSPWINGYTSGLELKASVLDANVTFVYICVDFLWIPRDCSTLFLETHINTVYGNSWPKM